MEIFYKDNNVYLAYKNTPDEHAITRIEPHIAAMFPWRFLFNAILQKLTGGNDAETNR